jgi:phage terminase large subunit-like protein
MEWSTSCPDWQERILAGKSLIPFEPLFPESAESALAVFNELRVADVAGSPMMGAICRPWIKDFVRAIFGAYEPDIGRQHIQEFMLSVSKKNSKSTTAAAIMLTALVRNWRESAEFLVLAPTIEIANNSFYPARDMVKRDAELSALFHVQEHYRTITSRRNGASLKVVAAENETVGGKKATGILVDELWQFGKRPNAENMFREAMGGLASRPEGFVIYLTTQSDEAPAGVFDQKLRYARGVRDGRIKDNRFLPVLYEFPPDLVKAEAYRDRRYFYITNPNLGASVDEEFLVRELAKSEEAGEHSLIGFFAKHANVEIGLALGSDRWVGAEYWEQQGTLLTLDDILARCEVVVIGIDGGGLDDLLGLAVVGREKVTGNWLHWAHAWAQPSVLERRKVEAARFRDFERDGDLTIATEKGQDSKEVTEIVEKCERSGLLFKIGVDQGGSSSVIDALGSINLGIDRIVAVPNNWRLMSAIQATERKLADDKLHHAGSRMMAWCVGNAKIELRGNAFYVTKAASGRAKIDPLMATFDAVAVMSMNPEPQRKEYQAFLV